MGPKKRGECSNNDRGTIITYRLTITWSTIQLNIFKKININKCIKQLLL